MKPAELRRSFQAAQLAFIAIMVLFASVTVGSAIDGSSTTADAASRSPLKEPAYRSNPKYSIIAFGDSKEVKVWMVEDGKRLFVDRNANGDLTDDGPAIQPSNVRSIGAKSWDFNYLLDAITPAS